MSPHKPLRTALIGLSSHATTSWASSAHLPGLLSPTGRSKLPIVALLNSSVEAAKSAIQIYNLDPGTKAYGSPEDLAKDPDIDAVICNTRVDKHYETIFPSIKAGKDVFVEWPVASNSRDIQTVVQEAKKSGSRVAVGLQRRWVPQVVKLREILKEGKLGKVLSSDVRAFGGTNDRVILPAGLKYFSERSVGGNVMVINFGHLFDMVLSVLGNLVPETVHSHLQLQRPDVKIRDPKTNNITETVRSTVPDLLSIHGNLEPSATTAQSATLSVLFRRGQPFPGTPVVTWMINCEHGEIRLVSPTGMALEASKEEDPVTIQVHWFDGDRVEDVPWEWSAEDKELPVMARSVFRTLEAWADGKDAGDGWVDVEDAAKRASLIESFLAKWEKEGQ